MHESVLAQQIVQTVLAEAVHQGAALVSSVDVAIGVRDGLSEDVLREAFAIEAKGTPLERAQLTVGTHEGRGLVVRRASFVT